MTEAFEAAWLALREGADHRARCAEVVPPLEHWWTGRGASTVLDLGCGTGSNLRWLAPRLPKPQRWTLVDHDGALLAHVQAPEAGVSIRGVEGDLAVEGLSEVAAADLVTASALLDLVSEAWLARLADACAAAGAAALFALSYDGAISWEGGADAGDALVRTAVNEHQRRDKGLGPALGPAAARTAEALFRARGYRTRLVPSPWTIGPGEADLARALIDGWAAAAAEQRPARVGEVRAWAERRRKTVAASALTLRVGHQDLLALPDGGSEPGT